MSQPNESTALSDDALISSNQEFRGVRTRSTTRKVLFALESIAIAAIYSICVFDKHFIQKYLMASYAIIYMLRLNVMTMWLLPREITTEELTGVMLIWVPAILLSFALLQNDVSPGTMILSMLLYCTGSFFNTYSEMQRKFWKQKNPGRCYTLGLFSLSRNINYFGDTLLFAGWAVVTGSWWNGWVPLVMGLSFYYYHIPSKESYLAERYHEDWPQYIKTTKSFIPHVC